MGKDAGSGQATSPQKKQNDSLVFFITGLLVGMVIIAGYSVVSREPLVGLADMDNDGVPDSHDLQPNGEANMVFTVAAIAHTELNETIEVNLSLLYDGNGDPNGNSNGQACNLTITIEANTSATFPNKSCTFSTSDWTILAVGFGYSMDSEIEEGGIYWRSHWDLYPDSGSDTAGYNSTIDPFILYRGTTIILNGLDDNDEHEYNARLTLLVSSGEEEN